MKPTMDNSLCDISRLKLCLERHARGDAAAREQLLHAACDRLRRLTRKMLRDFPEVHRWEETDDVWQNASLRLWRSLEHVQPVDARHFLRLAALQIRRELIDLARRHRSRVGMGDAYDVHFTREPDRRPAEHDGLAELTLEPCRLAEWHEFHSRVEALPNEDRETFDLLWYHGMTQEEAAEVLQVSVRTIRRRWRSARLRLHEALGADSADASGSY
jgi:RNA polymerase sigma-70 factor (ECF subfamily)